MLLYSKLLDNIREKLPPEWRTLLDPLFAEMRRKDIFIWMTFFIACAGFTLALMSFVNQFAEEEAKYNIVLTSTGRYLGENPDMASSSDPLEEHP